MIFATRFNQLQNDIIAKLTAITDRPDGWLPHLVFVEEEGEDGAPVYNQYRLVDFRTDGSCTLRNTITNEDDRERCLSEINIDWLLTVWRYYYDLSAVREEPEKELSVFLYPLDRLERNATDAEIIADWESDEQHDVPTRKLTPDEFAEECNDEMFADQIYWVRFINY